MRSVFKRTGGLANMERDRLRLRRVLVRFNKDELVHVVRKLGVEVNDRATKAQLVAHGLQHFLTSDTISRQGITELELQYILLHSNSVTWTALKLQQVTGAGSADIDNGTFLRRFQLYLADMCNYALADTIQSFKHWMCLHFEDSTLAPYSCFVLRYPPTPFILLAGVKKKHIKCIMEALSLTLECAGWSETELSGRSLDSLLDLLTNQYSQGAYAAYRLNQVDPNPLLAVAKRRQYSRMERDHTLKAAEEIFGTNPLPKLEKFTFKFEGPLGTNEAISCTVKFSGSDVLGGIKQCVAKDYISQPVPDSITNLPSYARNSVKLNISTCTTEHTDYG